MNTKHQRRASRAGQAMIEMMLGVILILLLLVGTSLFLDVADVHTGIDSRIRGRSGFLAMSPMLLEDAPRYIEDWQAGSDNQRYTADDRATCKSPVAIQMIANRTVTNNADWSVFGSLAHASSLEALHGSPVPLAALGFVGLREQARVPVSEFAQQFFYDKSDVVVCEDCWIPILNGLY